MSAYIGVDIETCRRQGHHFKVVGSDKTPLKKSLICEDCSIATGKSAYAAYGSDVGSFGQWKERPREAIL